MTDTMNTSGSTGQNEKQKVTLSVADLEIRDYFAAKAMAGMLAKEGWAVGMDVAQSAYVMADCMLRARG